MALEKTLEKVFFNIAKNFFILSVVFYPFSGLYVGFEVLKFYVIFGFLFITSVFFLIILNFIRINPDNLKNYIFLLIIAYTAFSSLSIFYTSDLSSTLLYLAKLYFFVTFATLTWVVLIYNKSFFSYMITSFSTSLIITAIYVYYKIYLFGVDKISYIFGNGLVGSGKEEFNEYIHIVFYSDLINNSQNVVASILSSWSILVIGYTIYSNTESKIKKIYYISSVIISLPVQYFALSKSGLICIILGYFLLFSYSLLRRNLYALKIVSLIVLSNIIILYINPLNIREGLIHRFKIAIPSTISSSNSDTTISSDTISSSNSDTTISSRKVLWNFALENFLSSPIFGHGYRSLLKEYREIGKSLKDEHISHPHNIYLQILSELGIIGFLIFLSLLITIYFNIAKNVYKKSCFSDYSFIVGVGITTYLIRGIFGFQFEELDIWLLLAISQYLYSYDKTKILEV